MKHTTIKFVFVLFIILLSKCSLFEFEWGKFYYKLPDNTYLTVWKHSFHKDYPIGDVIIIPGKYKGSEEPKDISYISASSISEVCLVYIKKNAENTIYIDTTRSYMIEINNNTNSTISFEVYSDSLKYLNEYPRFKERMEVQLDIHYNNAFVRQYLFETIKPSEL